MDSSKQSWYLNYDECLENNVTNPRSVVNTIEKCSNCGTKIEEAKYRYVNKRYGHTHAVVGVKSVSMNLKSFCSTCLLAAPVCDPPDENKKNEGKQSVGKSGQLVKR